MNFDAPWGIFLRLTMVVATAVLLGLAGWGLLHAERGVIWQLAMIVLPLLILAGSIPFVVRGYVLDKGRLGIRRLGWITWLDLAGLESATFDPQAMRGSLRALGNGGLFVIAGWYCNRRLGRYRAFATDPANAVVLRFATRTVVVTPDEPTRFARRLTAALAVAAP